MDPRALQMLDKCSTLNYAPAPHWGILGRGSTIKLFHH